MFSKGNIHDSKAVSVSGIGAAKTIICLLLLTAVLSTIVCAGWGWKTLPTGPEIQAAAASAVPTAPVEEWTTSKRHDASQSVQNPLWVNQVVLAWIETNPNFISCQPNDPDCTPIGTRYWCGHSNLSFDNGWAFELGDPTLGVDSLSQCIGFISYAPGWVGQDNQPPTVAMAYTPLNPTVNDTVEITSNASDPDGDILSFKWFLNGHEQTAVEPFQHTIVWRNPLEGTHTATVQVSDGNGGTAEDSVTFTVSTSNEANRPPTVNLTYSPSNPKLNEKIHFDPNASDPDGDELFYAWFINDVEISLTSPSISWTPPEGTHTVAVEVSDRKPPEGLTAEDSATFEIIGNLPPTVKLSCPAPNGSYFVFKKDPVKCIATGSDPDGDNLFYEWSIGTSKQTNETSSNFDWNPSFEATFKISVRASDGQKKSEEAYTVISVSSPVSGGSDAMLRLVRGSAFLSRTKGSTWLDLGPEPVTTKNYDMVKTGPSSRAVLTYADGSVFRMKSNTILTILPNGIQIVVGTSWFNLQKRGRSFFIANPAFGGVLGSEGTIIVEEDGTTTLTIFEGHAIVADLHGRKTVELGSGDMTTGSPDGVPSGPQPFDPDMVDRWWEDDGPSQSSGDSVETALDTDNNGKLDDLEIIAAVQYWILGQTIPGTEQTIDDDKIRELIQMWILGTPVSPSIARAHWSPNRPALSLTSPHPLARQVSLNDPSVSVMSVQVFDLSDRLINHDQGQDRVCALRRCPTGSVA